MYTESFASGGLDVPVPAESRAACVDLHRFRCHATVAVLVLEVIFDRQATFEEVQRLAHRVLDLPTRPSVTPGNNTVAPLMPDSRFFIRFHDLRSRKPVQTLIAALAREFTFASPARVRELKVAIDFYSTAHDRGELVQLRDRLLRTDQATAMRVAAWDSAVGRNTQLNCIPDEGTVSIEKGGMTWRTYLSPTDERPLVASGRDHRVRVELNMKGTDLPEAFRDIEALGAFRFEALTKYFKYRQQAPSSLTAPATPTEALAQRVANYVLDRLGFGARRTTRRKYPPDTVADCELHGRIRDALRNLSTSWQR